MWRKWGRRSTTMTIVIACLAAGCAGAGGSSPVAACDSPGVTPGTIKIGYIFPDTGNTAGLFNASRSGVEARVEAANAAGGIHGRKIEIVWRDDQSDTAINLTAAQNLVERENVFGIIETTSYATGSAQYLNERNVPVAGNTLEAVWSRYRNMFSYAYRTTSGGSITTWGTFAKAHGGSRAVVVEAKIAEASRSFGDNLAASLRSAGIDVTDILDYTPGVTDLNQIGRQIQASGADVLSGALPAEDFTRVQIAAVAAGAQPKVIMTPTGYDRSLLNKFGPQVAGTYYFINYRPSEEKTAAQDTYLRAMSLYSPELQPPDQELALTGYINTDLFLAGLEAAGACPTRAKFVDNLRAVHNYDGGGLLPAPVDLGVVGQLNVCYTFLRANPAGSAFEIVKGAAPLCGQRTASTSATP